MNKEVPKKYVGRLLKGIGIILGLILGSIYAASAAHATQKSARGSSVSHSQITSGSRRYKRQQPNLRRGCSIFELRLSGKRV
jgi:hypothetical protein